MKKKNILIVLISFLLLLSCKTPNKDKKESLWVVKIIENEDYLDEVLTTYRLITTDTTDFNSDDMWIVDSVGAFQVGDTLKFSKK